MKLGELTAALALRVVLDRLGGGGGAAKPAKRGRRRGGARSATRPAAEVRRGPLFMVMLAAGGIAVPLMIIFEHPITRVVGVLGLFIFILAGVFVIADPGFLDQEDDT